MTAKRAASKRALRWALAILTLFLFAETVGGIVANSLALLSDAAHLLTDVIAVGIALFAQWFATRPASARRSYGYPRVEIMAALFNGLTLCAVAVFISIEAVERMFDPPQVQGGLMLIVATLGFVAQVAATLVLAKASGESLNVRAAYIHALLDAIQSIGVIAAAVVVIHTGFAMIDPIVSIAISVMIFWSGAKITGEAVHILLEGTPREIDLDALAVFMTDVPGVRRVSDLHAWSLTTGVNAMSAHVVGDSTLDAEGREALTIRLTEEIKSGFPLHHITLQVERCCEIDIADGCFRCSDGDNVVPED